MARGVPGPHTFWDDARSAKLRKLWGTLSMALIAERMGCSRTSVDKQARKLNLPKLDAQVMRNKGR